MQRRTFLGAAAAAAALPAATDAGEGRPEDLVDDVTGSEDYDYAQAECGDVMGTLNHVDVADDMEDGPVAVTGVREDDGWSGVSLDWSCGPVSAGTGLSPDDARELAARLRVAAAFAEGDLEDVGGGGGGA